MLQFVFKISPYIYPTDTHQKEIQHAIKKCNTLTEKHTQKYLINIKPTAPKLNVYIKTHKENEPNRPAVKNIYAPTHTVARYLNKKTKQPNEPTMHVHHQKRT